MEEGEGLGTRLGYKGPLPVVHMWRLLSHCCGMYVVSLWRSLQFSTFHACLDSENCGQLSANIDDVIAAFNGLESKDLILSMFYAVHTKPTAIIFQVFHQSIYPY